MGQGVPYKLIYLARRARTVSREDWPRTWKSHAIFASQFPVIERGLRWLRYCNRIDEPLVTVSSAGLPQLTTEHDGVAVAGSETLESISGGTVSPAVQDQVDEDERRVFDMLTPHFTFLATETLLKDGPLGKVALFHFLPRAAGLTREQFATRYRTEHAEPARLATAAITGLTRAALNYPVNDPLPLFPFDGISENWFETADAAVNALADGGFDLISRDLAPFCDLDRSILMLTSVCHRWSEP